MKLDFRQRLLATTLLVGAGMVAAPAFAQDQAPVTPPTCPPGVPVGTNGCNAPEPVATTAPASAVPPAGENANGAPTTAPQEIIVTGTRIPQPNLQTASPVTTVTSQEVKVSGTTRTEDLINSLPQVFADQGSNVSNGASGTANIDLRGLGAKRTLVLINGKRMGGGDPGDPVPDINFIPVQLVKRVDVLTGGASAVYGADAVAGVVNFILDDSFTGLRVDAQGSFFNHSQHANDGVIKANQNAGYLYPTGMSNNGGTQDIAGMFGASFADGRGHVTAYATYHREDPVLESTRDYSFCALGRYDAAGAAAAGTGFYCGGSATSDTGTFEQFTPAGNYVTTYHVVGNKFAPGYTLFNYAPYNYFQRPDERYTLGAFANYEISPAFKPYAEMMFMNDHTDALIAPSGDFGNTSILNCGNPLMSDQERATICAPGMTFTDPQTGQQDAVIVPLRRNVEGGGRDDDLEHTDWRVVAGMRGDIARGLSYDGSYQFSKSELAETYYNDFSVNRLTNALDVVSVDANGNILNPGDTGFAAGTPECYAAYTGADSACVPYNIFQAGGVTQAALGYISVPGFERGDIAQTVAELDVTFTGADYGLQTPWADSGVGVSLGTDYMKNSLSFSPDVEFQTGDLAGQGATVPPVGGSIDVREAYGEIQIPLVEHSFFDLLQVDGGYRYSNYHIAGRSVNTDTYKLEAEFAPVRDIRFRGSYNRAVRAPAVSELFSPVSVGLVGSQDYCTGPAVDINGQSLVNGTRTGPDPTDPNATGFTAAQCANSGVTAAQFGHLPTNPANQYTGQLGGNPNLQPEKADTWTAGVILQPRWIPGLALSADYFNIKVKGEIQGLPWQTVLLSCVNSDVACNLVHRDQFGSLWQTPNGYINVQAQNIGGLSTKGFDFQGSYAHRLGGLGTLNVSFVGTYLKHLITDTGLAPGNGLDGVFDCASYYGNTCGTPNPRWRHKLRVGLTLPNGLGASVAWRHFSSVQIDTLSDDPDLNGGAGPSADPVNALMGQRNYFDLAFTARLEQRLNLRLGVNNILDTDPPLNGLQAAGFGNGNTYPQVYDSLGRYVFAGFTVDF